uniref:Uncharacterized protein n=1 Tax=Wuchereria bancrofti TaxID=6293 RepID=A0AAF5RT44_WUCBA
MPTRLPECLTIRVFRQTMIVPGSGAAINDIRKMSLTKSKTTLHSFDHLVKGFFGIRCPRCKAGNGAAEFL